MYIAEEINIQQMIVHILDNQLGIPVFSTDQIPDSLEIKEYIINHIIKVINDDGLKPTNPDIMDNPFYNRLIDYNEKRLNFIEFSIEMAQQLFTLMTSYANIDPCDLLTVSFTINSEPYIALLKMNYQSTYIHFTDYESDQNVNTIMEHKTTLPSMGQKVSEAILIRLTDLVIKVLEKRHDMDGQQDFYLSKHFIKGHNSLSSKEQMKIVKTAAEQVAKQFFEYDPEKKAEIKQNLYQSLDDNGTINLETFAEKAFIEQPEIKEIFKEKLEKKGLKDPLIQLEEKTILSNFEKQRVKTDTGIEIKIPMSMYNDPDTMEFITEANGKISIVLKNIGKII